MGLVSQINCGVCLRRARKFDYTKRDNRSKLTSVEREDPKPSSGRIRFTIGIIILQVLEPS